MEMRKLGRTGLDVTICCLGTMTFGTQNTEQEGYEQMDYALDKGVNFFDTAEMYSIPPTAESYGNTEKIIGNYFKARKNRDKIILASKIAGRSAMNWLRPEGEPSRITKKQIDIAIEQSLKRLQTDYIDLYQIHWPDRKLEGFGFFNYKHYENDYIAFYEALEHFQKHIEKGNIRHLGASNESAWGVMQYVKESEKNNLPRIASIQNAYHLLNRTFEYGLAETALNEAVGLLAYSPLAQGYLTGKYLNGALPEGARTTLFGRGQRYETPSADIMIEKYIALATELGMSAVDLSLKFCATRPFMTSVIIGARTMDQLKTAIGAFDAKWDDSIEARVNSLHRTCPNPCP